MKSIKSKIVSGAVGLGMLFSIGCSPKYQKAIIIGDKEFYCWFDKKDSIQKVLVPADTNFDFKYDKHLAFPSNGKAPKMLYPFFRNDRNNDPKYLLMRYQHKGKDNNKMKNLRRITSKK